MKIVALSDSHNQKPKMPDGDLLIHSGDLTMGGTKREVKAAIKWLGDLARNKYEHGVVLVPGNHDFLFETFRPGLPLFKRGIAIEREPEYCKELCEKQGVDLVMNESFEVAGIKMWGSPIQPWFHDWAFNVHRGEIGLIWDKIPLDVQLLITHGPPYGLGDLCRGGNVGCQALLERIKLLKEMKLHIFGHIHEGAGVHWFNSKMFLNASVLDHWYNGFNAIHVVEWPNLKVEKFPDESI